MSYATQSLLARDADFVNRCNAAAAKEAIPGGEAPGWVALNIWAIAASPGFDEAYASALVAGIGLPGWDESVITDGMILSSVQALLA